MRSIKDVEDIKTRYVEELYALTRKEQGEDELYYSDKFSVPEIQEPHHVYRSGIGSRIVDAPAEHIVSTNPQAFFDIRKGSKASGLKISELINQVWFDILRRGNPQIFRENIKHQLRYGESYIQVIHNESWLDDNGKQVENPIGQPVRFRALNPMVVYGSPDEDENGTPNIVVVFYPRQLSDVILRYPNSAEAIKEVKKDGKESKQVEWFEFWTKDERFFSANGVPVLKGEVQKNIYGLVPFIRKYSGFGSRSSDGELSNLIVSDIRFSRDLVREECATRSNISSIDFLFAHKPKTVVVPSGTNVETLRSELGFGQYDLNVIVSSDVNAVKFIETDITIPPEMQAHHAAVRAELNQRHPFIMAGFPMGANGRQQDMTTIAAMRRYDSTVENTENLFGTAIEMGFKIMNAVGIVPNGLSKTDMDTQFKCEVKLKAVEAIEMDRTITLGQRLYSSNPPVISLHELHTKYFGLTEDEHNTEVQRILADRATFLDPTWATVIGQAAAAEAGLTEQLEQAKAQLQQQPGMPATTQQRIQGESQTDLGMEQGTAPRVGARQSPERFVRGGE